MNVIALPCHAESKGDWVSKWKLHDVGVLDRCYLHRLCLRAACFSLRLPEFKNRVGSRGKKKKEQKSEWVGGSGGELEGIKEEMGGNEQELAPCEDQPYWESASEIFN